MKKTVTAEDIRIFKIGDTAQYLPKIDGSFTTILMKDQDIIGMSLQARGTYMAGLNITEPLYVGGRITAAA